MNGVKDMALVDRQDIAPPQESATGAFERLARDPAVDVDKLERLMQMHERMQARFSQEQFNAAMAQAQKAMRPVATDSFNLQTKSRYASYEALDGDVRPIYAEHGFGLSFNTGECPTADCVRVVCDVTHTGGHSKSYHIDMPADGKGAKGGDVMTRTHATGAAVSYGMRYLLKMIFNIAVGEGDDDGNTAGAKAKAVKSPAGFDGWLSDLQAAAENGTPVLSEAWKQSKVEYRNHITAAEWERLKRVGVHVTAAQKKAADDAV